MLFHPLIPRCKSTLWFLNLKLFSCGLDVNKIYCNFWMEYGNIFQMICRSRSWNVLISVYMTFMWFHNHDVYIILFWQYYWPCRTVTHGLYRTQRPYQYHVTCSPKILCVCHYRRRLTQRHAKDNESTDLDETNPRARHARVTGDVFVFDHSNHITLFRREPVAPFRNLCLPG